MSCSGVQHEMAQTAGMEPTAHVNPAARMTPTAFPKTRARVRDGARFCALVAEPQPGPGPHHVRLLAICTGTGSLFAEEHVVSKEDLRYAALTPDIPAAAWYERKVRDLYGIEPVGHPRPDPLVAPRPVGTAAPLGPGGNPKIPLLLDPRPLPAHVHGEGVFTIPYGPVRSGVFEAVEYVLETSGEDIPHLRTRIFYKHRGVDSHFAGMCFDDGVLLAEREEGVASVAHALAFSQAVEELAGVAVPLASALVRVVHAELERVANHLDSMIRHTEAAGQAVAYAVFSHHKERVQRLRGRLCGSRFGRGVVVPGGVRRGLGLAPDELLRVIALLSHEIAEDVRRLMDTPSFVDRLRGTGVLSPEDAARLAVVGPVGRGSGQHEDLRTVRPYGAYTRLGYREAHRHGRGDALARQAVRIEELDGAFHFVRQAVDLLDELGEPEAWQVSVPRASGRAIGWVESPQGELLSVIEARDGQLTQVTQRSPGFHNLGAYSAAFGKDIFTDVAFIEASFGLSIAGAAG